MTNEKTFYTLKYKHLMLQKCQLSQHEYIIYCNFPLEAQAFFFSFFNWLKLSQCSFARTNAQEEPRKSGIKKLIRGNLLNDTEDRISMHGKLSESISSMHPNLLGVLYSNSWDRSLESPTTLEFLIYQVWVRLSNQHCQQAPKWCWCGGVTGYSLRAITVTSQHNIGQKKKKRTNKPEEQTRSQ